MPRRLLVICAALTALWLGAPAVAMAGTLTGGAGADTLTGGSGPDRLLGRGGPDRLAGRGGADEVFGGGGGDRLSGGPGDDRLSGGPGRDRIRARDGAADRVACGAGRDRVIADAADLLSGCETVRLPRAPAPPPGPGPAPAPSAVPTGPLTLDVTLAGTTYAFDGDAGQYVPREDFRRAATLVIAPHPAGGDRRVVGVFSGRPLVAAEAGSVRWGTHTAVFGLVGVAPVDLATVTVDPVAGTLHAEVDRTAARAFTQSVFHWRTAGRLGSPVQILAGTADLAFGAGTVTGQLTLAGGGSIEPGAPYFPPYGMAARVTAPPG